MAKTKNKTSIRDKPGGKPKGKSWWIQLLRFLAWRPAWLLMLLILLLALILWQWSYLVSWAEIIAISIWKLLGWGLPLILLALIIMIGVLWRGQLSAFVRQYKLYLWNKWLGAVAFFVAAWGILTLFGLGGSIGLKIIGSPDFDGILRVLGLVVLGTILMAPRACFRATIGLISWLVGLLKPAPSPTPKPVREPPQPQPQPPPHPTMPRPRAAETIIPPPVIVPPEISLRKPQDIEAITAAATLAQAQQEVEAATTASTTAEAQRELKQVAQEVWKKYGESPGLVTIDGWRLPPIDILDTSPEVEFGQADNMQRAKLIEDALASYGVEAQVVQINAGPTVTQFGVEPGWDRKMKEIKERDRDGTVNVRMQEVSKTRVKVERITSLSNDLALALAASSIRIEAPVPGKSVVGIEVPNTTSSVVSVRGVIETSSFQKTLTKSKMSLALGKGAGGEAIVADLTRMPHLLIAGATGSGKTVCLNAVICCLLLHNTPNDIKFIMVDPKRVELTPFNSIPHLATPVIVDTNKALGTLRWLNEEMDKRYKLLAKVAARNIEAYNRTRQGVERLPYMVLIIDELADLMMAGFDEVEHILCRLAQLARATGIHLVVATQRPSVDVVTGLIKANFPTRISFAVTSQVDSRTILDIGGAEKLLGRGDMLYMPTEAAKPKRLQGCYVSDAETERLVYFWGNQRKEEPDSLKIEELTLAAARKGSYPPDPLLESARQLAEEHKHISTSYLQRKLHIGYPRAARIMEQLEEEGIEGGEEGEV